MPAPDFWIKIRDDVTAWGGDYATDAVINSTLPALNPSRTITGLRVYGNTTPGYFEKDVSAQSYVSGWAGFIYDAVHQGSDAILPLFELEGDQGTPLFKITQGATNFHSRFHRWDGSAWQQIGSDFSTVLLNASPRFDVNFNIADAGGVFEVYVNGSSVASFTGDTKTTADTTIDTVRCSMNTTNNGSYGTFGGLIIDAADTRKTHMHEPSIIGDGTNNDTGASRVNLDEYVGNVQTNDFATFDAVNEQADFSYAAFNAAVTDSYTIEACRLMLTAKAVADPGWDLEGYAVISATEYTDNNSVQVTGPDWAVFEIDFDLDPSTGSAWANKSAIEDADIGVESLTPT